MSVLKLATDCAPNAVNAVTALVAPVPPFAIGKIPITPLVNGKPMALVNVPEAGMPNAGAVKMGAVKVLFVKVSVPAKVAKVPEAPGKVIVVVPATAGAAKVAVPEVDPAKPTLVAEAAPKVGVTNVGEVENTTEPVPVSLVRAVAKFTLVGVIKNVPTPEPKLLMSVVPNVSQRGEADIDPDPVCARNFLVNVVFPGKYEVVFAAD